MIVWVVTGCSNGLGKDICIGALARGHKVIATCRGNAQERLADLVVRGASVLSLDVTASSDELKEFAQKAIGIHGQVDVVCNNAGYVLQGALEEASEEETLRSYQTLVFGPLNIARAFLPHMRERRTGAIGMIGTRGAQMGIPGCGVYTSAKAALTALTQTLAAEVESFDIKATCIELGDFRTNVWNVSTRTTKHYPEYEPVLAPVFAHLNPQFKQDGNPRKGAERIVDVLTGAGHASGRKLPFRIMLGDDAYETASELVQIRAKEIKEWEEWSTGTNFS